MKILQSILIIFLFIANSVAQQLPYDFRISENGLKKTNDATPVSNTTERILIHDNTIWLGTSHGLSKSTDNGATWINYFETEPFGTESISSVANNDGVIWTATWHNEDNHGSAVPLGTGLRYTVDNGASWVTVEQPIDDPGDSSIVYGINTLRALPVTVPHQNFIYDMAFSGNTIWIATFAGGLRKSSDMGQTWERVVLPPDYLDSIKPTDSLNFSLQPVAGAFGTESYLNHRVFSILTTDENTLYVGTAGGINKSTDGGISWVKFNHTNQTNSISGNHILKLVHNKFDNSIWAATWKAEGESEFWAVSYSYDGGDNWNNTLPSTRTMDFAFRQVGDSNSDVIAATQDGLYRSNNYGKTWIAAPEIFDDATKISINTRHFRAVEFQSINPTTSYLWIGTSGGGLIRFEDQGNMWNGSWKVYLKSGEPIVKKETYAFPNPFSPNVRNTRIKYSTEKNTEVTIRIFDFGMNLVRTLIQNAPRGQSDEHLENWDGRDEKNQIVPNGVYFYRIDVGSDEPVFGKIMVLM